MYRRELCDRGAVPYSICLTAIGSQRRYPRYVSPARQQTRAALMRYGVSARTATRRAGRRSQLDAMKTIVRDAVIIW